MNNVQSADLSRLNKIYLLPSLFTAGNLFFGFLAIIRCIQAKYELHDALISTNYYTQAVWFILLAFICDILDGRVARIGGQESLFGKEFDSIADAISFGLAPALMVFFLILSPTEGYPVFRQMGWVIGFIYLLCAGVRLARFNVLTHPLLPEEARLKNQNQFVGLPVPAAAALIASLALVLTELESRLIWFCMPPLMLLVAWLMVSNIPYPSFKNINWEAETRVKTLIICILLLSLLVFLEKYAFVLIFSSYIFYGLTRFLRENLLKRHSFLKK